MDATIANVAVGLIVGGAAVISNLMISAKATGKTEGAIQTGLGALSKRVDDVDKRIEDVDQDNKAQWKTIERHTGEIGYLQGKVNGKAPGRL